MNKQPPPLGSTEPPRAHDFDPVAEALPAVGAGQLSNCAKALPSAQTGVQGVRADHRQSRRMGTALRAHYFPAQPSRPLRPGYGSALSQSCTHDASVPLVCEGLFL